MADIVIHGMDVPKLCCECPLKESMYDVGYICLPRKEPIKVNHHKGIDDACPLLPLPEGHGRLIDADKLNYTMLYKENWMRGTGVEAPAIWKSDIDAADTIVPAEGGGEDG